MMEFETFNIFSRSSSKFSDLQGNGRKCPYPIWMRFGYVVEHQKILDSYFFSAYLDVYWLKKSLKNNDRFGCPLDMLLSIKKH